MFLPSQGDARGWTLDLSFTGPLISFSLTGRNSFREAPPSHARARVRNLL
jgi:hypothetical protein